MPRQTVATDAAPQAIGPYAQAIVSDGLLFVSGQIPLDPATGELLDGTIEQQTERALLNLQAILVATGASLADVVKTTVFLADIGEFAAMNGVYARFFGDAPPARSAFQVAALPKGARVEIEAIARLP